ncbi:MAG: hypothetical protein IPK85_01390 [Gemmatimonadetes bacterium]|nr:hypothetical protein [Gemmatimonadota bacterium]
MPDLRTLAQAVVDAHAAWVDEYNVPQREHVEGAYDAFTKAIGPVYDGDTAKRILAALDAERAQGYARAMGEVVERADHSADYTGWSDYALGHRDAHERLAVWARERLPAEAERD